MKKKISLIILLLISITIYFGSLITPPRTVRMSIEHGIPVFHINTEKKTVTIVPWQDPINKSFYIVLPSFSARNTLQIDDITEYSATWNNTKLNSHHYMSYNEGEPVLLDIEDIEGNQYFYELNILYSENLPSIFIQTDSGDLNFLHTDKENCDSGQIIVAQSDGTINYHGSLEQISGRGNSTWGYQKKPYRFKLPQNQSLLGMDIGKTWNLLPSWNEGSKLNTKIAFDLGTDIGLEYNPQCEWVDLYINGDYRGIYYLSENINIDTGRVDIAKLDSYSRNISGGYLIEKDYSAYQQDDISHFTTTSGYFFSIKSPQDATSEQLIFIQNYVDNLDKKIQSAQCNLQEDIDLPSFAKKFVIDELAINMDIGITSTYFYKKVNDSKLYAGPIWDFDKSFGENNGRDTLGQWTDYSISITNMPSNNAEILPWNTFLYEDESFKAAVASEFTNLLPHIEYLLNEKIDSYTSKIQKAIAMDNIRWYHAETYGYSPGHYTTFENNVRYFKYYLTQRTKYLHQLWNIDYPLNLPSTNTTEHHIVSLIDQHGNISTLEVADGATNLELPLSTGSWFYQHNGEAYSPYIPIYEDCVLYNE